MAAALGKTHCTICGKEKVAYSCPGCAQNFCLPHLGEHHQLHLKQLDDLENERNLFRQTLSEQSNDPQKHALIQQINQWEHDSINKIQHTAEEVRQTLLERITRHTNEVEVELIKFTGELKDIRQEDDFNELHLNRLRQNLNQLEEQLKQPPTISIEQDNSSSLIHRIFVSITSASRKRRDSEDPTQQFEGVIAEYCHFQMIEREQLFLPDIPTNTKWSQSGLTVAGGNGQGNELNQLSRPWGVCINDDQTIYVADYNNHRIVEWKKGAISGQIVAGGRGQGNRNDQLNYPFNVIVDKKNDALIICDRGNWRVVRWPRRNGTSGETVISNVDCSGLSMDKDGYLYASDIIKHEVRRWKMGETNGTMVAGGNGDGNRPDQLFRPYFTFVDEDQSVYVSDFDNHRVMKWMKGAKEGIVVAGGQGQGNDLSQLSYPCGVVVDQLGTVYVADQNNQRVMGWVKGGREGSVVIGENGQGVEANQLKFPFGLSFDRQNYLYVADFGNDRVQKFCIDLQ